MMKVMFQNLISAATQGLSADHEKQIPTVDGGARSGVPEEWHSEYIIDSDYGCICEGGQERRQGMYTVQVAIIFQ